MYTARKFWEPVGYYPVALVQDYPQERIYDMVGDAFCYDCAQVHGRSKCGDECCEPWDVDEAEPIWYWHEADTPTHCTACETLIQHDLTSDGIQYVRDAVEENPDSEIVQKWNSAYLLP